jgi:hypothetical protein
MCRGEETSIQGFLVRKPEGNTTRGRPEDRWECVEVVKKGVMFVW